MLVRIVNVKERKPLPDGIPATQSEEERTLMHQLDQHLSDDQYTEKLWQLVRFYLTLEIPKLAAALIYQILESADSADTKALCYYRLGAIAEGRNQYSAAIDFYMKGITFRTGDREIQYRLHNSAAYCLSVQRKYRPAERYCLSAIEIDPARHNAYKNLGISLAGQEKIVEAVRAFIIATKVYPLDTRAFYLAQDLVNDHRKLMTRYPTIRLEIEECKKLIAAITNKRKATPTYEICRLKYLPAKGFWELKNRVIREISLDEVARRYTEKAIYMTRQYPSKWCDVLKEKVNGSNLSRKIKKSTKDFKNLLPLLVLTAGEQHS